MIVSRSADGVVLLVPAYNPSLSLPELLETVLSLPECPICGVVVVDDGSLPQFGDIFKKLEAIPGVSLLRHAINLGKGAALKTGLNFTMVHWPEAAGVVTADADGQHAPDDIAAVARELKRSPDCLVLGSRRFAGAVPFRSRFGNSLTKRVFRIATGKDISDTQTGLRGWPRRACLAALRIPLNGYDFELECLVRAEHGVREVPIQTIYLDGNRSSHFNPVRDSMRIYFVFLRYCGSAVLAAVIDSAVFFTVSAAGQPLVAAQAAGRVVAATVAFMVARNLVFRSEKRIPVALAQYVALLVIMGFVSFNLLQALHERLGFPILAAKLTAEGLLFVGNFALQRDFVFVRKTE